jgi:hypothetical protein
MTSRKSCKKGYTRSRETGRCRKNARKLQKQLDDLKAQRYYEFMGVSDEETERRNRLGAVTPLNLEELGKIDVGGVARGDFLGPLRPGGMYGGGVTDGNVTGGKKMSKYNAYVKEYSRKHKNLKGKSLIKAAAKSWNACKRKGTSKCQNKKSRSRSRSRM